MFYPGTDAEVRCELCDHRQLFLHDRGGARVVRLEVSLARAKAGVSQREAAGDLK